MDISDLIEGATKGVNTVNKAVGDTFNFIDNVSDLVDGSIVMASPRQTENEWEFVIEREPLAATLQNPDPTKITQILQDEEILPDMKFRVRSVSFPQLQLVTQRTKWGTNPFTDYEHPEVVNIVMEEDIFFSTFRYFTEWQHQVFDPEKNVFKVSTDTSHIYRQGFLTLGKAIPVLGGTGLSLRMSNLKFLGYEPLTLVYDGEDALLYNLTFAVETVLPVGADWNKVASFLSTGLTLGNTATSLLNGSFSTKF